MPSPHIIQASDVIRTALVTGGGGYIGSWLCSILLAQGWKVKALDTYAFGLDLVSDLIANKDFQVINKDIREVTPKEFEGVDAVFDLASLSNDPTGDIDPALTHSINCLGRIRVANAAKAAGVSRYILAGTCSVYGHQGDEVAHEGSPCNPLTAYSRASVAAEDAILPLSSRDFCVTSLRQATVFGLSRRMRFDLVVNIMTLNAFERGRITIKGGGSQWRPLIHVQDTCRAFAAVGSAPKTSVNGEIFNVAGKSYQIREIAEEVQRTLPIPVQIDWEDGAVDHRNYNVTSDKIRKRLGWVPKTDVSQGSLEIFRALESGTVLRGMRTVTLDWYRHLALV